MRMAYSRASELSDNPKTQTGAVLVHPNFGLIGFGANKFPVGIVHDESKLIGPAIYDWLDHAEESAIRMAINDGYSNVLENSVLFTPWIPCSGCARDIIGYGIPEVVMHKDLNDFDKKITDKNWGQEASLEMFDCKKISYRFIEGKLFDSDFYINFRGKTFSP